MYLPCENSEIDEIYHSSHIKSFIAEGFPEVIQKRLQERDDALAHLLCSTDIKPEYVLAKLLKWKPGQSITVAFNGGDISLHHDIVSAAEDWTNEANLFLDFGFNVNTGKYREWSFTDTEYHADIRIAFLTDKKHGGYWSYVGMDSINKELAKPNEPSLNLHGFDVSRPNIWRFITIHEFGHAIGLKHEHQHPTQGCESEVRWEDDSGYIPTRNPDGGYVEDNQGRKPGIYTILGGPPNNWPRDKVDYAIRNLPDEHAYDFSEFDKLSVMKYVFPASWLKGGDTSRCFGVGPNLILSEKDKAGVKLAYPHDQNHINIQTKDRRRLIDLLRSIEIAHASLSYLAQ